MKTNSFRAVMVLSMLVGLTALTSADAATRGSAAAKADASLTIDEMLVYAIQDEYAAQAEYNAIVVKYGAIRPFTNTVRAEQSHIAWLKDLFVARSKNPPADDLASQVSLPSTLVGAYSAGVQAETDNIAMYDRFLDSAALKDPANKAIRDTFSHLRDASQNHLTAFQRSVARR